MTPELRFVPFLGPHGFHRLAYWEWAGTGARTVICAHGLTRNGRDFDRLAAALSQDARVACPDFPGRGRSEWLEHPEDYAYPTYLAAAAALIARLGADRVDWVGTSMGGLVGMMLASLPGSPVRRLVLNDVGPLVPGKALERIGAYVGADPRFRSLEELEAYLREIHAPFGPLSDGDWAHLARHGSRRLPDGTWALAYDPKIGQAFRAAPPDDVDLWDVWDRVRCPVLVLRGGSSDVLLPDTAREMTRRGPGARVVTIPATGHAPALMDPGQVRLVRDWLAG